MDIDTFLKSVLEEDIGRGDLYRKISSPQSAHAKILAKESGILAGVPYITRLAEMQGISFKLLKQDANSIEPGDTVAELFGEDHALLENERTFLNLLQHASGIATLTHKYAEKISDLPTLLLDTRKTRPMLRSFEKYATVTGGATNHRMGLDDCLMLKDTHLKNILDLSSFIQKARQKIPFTTKIEVECESLDQAMQAMHAHADVIMCDNMSPAHVKEVVEYRNKNHPEILLECSGNVTKENIRDFALTGVDAISCGSIIHQATWLDFNMKMQ